MKIKKIIHWLLLCIVTIASAGPALAAQDNLKYVALGRAIFSEISPCYSSYGCMRPLFLHSSDGKTWDIYKDSYLFDHTGPDACPLNIVSNGTQFVATLIYPTLIATYTENNTWLIQNVKKYASFLPGLAWNGHMWLAAGSNGEHRYDEGKPAAIVSKDGINWQPVSESLPLPNDNFSDYVSKLASVAWNGSAWVITGARQHRNDGSIDAFVLIGKESPEGQIKWELHNIFDGAKKNGHLYKIYWVKNQKLFYAIWTDSYSIFSSNSKAIFTSEDGIKWNQLSLPFDLHEPRYLITAANANDDEFAVIDVVQSEMRNKSIINRYITRDGKTWEKQQHSSGEINLDDKYRFIDMSWVDNTWTLYGAPPAPTKKSLDPGIFKLASESKQLDEWQPWPIKEMPNDFDYEVWFMTAK